LFCVVSFEPISPAQVTHEVTHLLFDVINSETADF